MSLKSKVKIEKLFQVDEKILTFDSTDAELLFTGSIEEPSYCGGSGEELSSYYAKLYRTKKGHFVLCKTDEYSDSKDYNVYLLSKKEAVEFCIKNMRNFEVTKIFKDEIEEL